MSKEEKIAYMMIDIETFGKTPGSVILSIGAVGFDIETGEILQEFYEVIDLESSIHAGLKVDSSTLMWWMSKDQTEARNALLEELNGGNGLDVYETLVALACFIEDHTKDCDSKIIWANPPTFDLMILESVYDILYIELPWKHYEMMDLRTLKKFYTGPRPRFRVEGHKHNALYDAKLQAMICSHIWNWLKKESHIHNPVTGSDYEVVTERLSDEPIKSLWDGKRTVDEVEEVEDFIDEMITKADTSVDVDDQRDYWKGYKKASQNILDWIRDWNTPDDDVGQ